MINKNTTLVFTTDTREVQQKMKIKPAKNLLLARFATTGPVLIAAHIARNW